MDTLDRIATHPTSLARNRERIAMLTESARRAGAYVAGARLRRIFPHPEAVAALESFRRPLQDDSRTPMEVLRELDTFGSPATVVQHQGRYFGFVNGGVEPAASGAAVLAGAWDQNAALPVMSPAAAALDEVAAGWIVDLLGLPQDATASFCAGATIANLTALLTARDTLLRRAGWDVATQGLAGSPAVRVIVGAEAHSSALKALRLAGFGSDSFEAIPTDATGAIDAAAFPADLDDRTLVVLQAGNVNTGASDPFDTIMDRVGASGAWVHVDGAFGLWAAASPRRRGLVAGVERADSWAVDAHKWLNVPYDSALTIVRDRDALLRAMSSDGAYLPSDEGRAPMREGIQMSQRARGVEAWAALSARGRDGIAALVDDPCDLAQHFATLLEAEGVRLLAPVVLNQALVAFGVEPGAEPDASTTATVLAAVQEDGTMWAGSTTWHGVHAMRLSVSDAATTRDDVEAAAQAILRAWSAARGA